MYRGWFSISINKYLSLFTEMIEKRSGERKGRKGVFIKLFTCSPIYSFLRMLKQIIDIYHSFNGKFSAQIKFSNKKVKEI